MNTPLFIALRYFFSPKKRNFINIISGLSVLGVMVGTIALVVVLSVFNGLEHLIKGLFGSFDPHLKISLAAGKSFTADEHWLQTIRETEGVLALTEVIEDNALFRYKEKQMVVKIKGVSENFTEQCNIDSTIKEGKCRLMSHGREFAIVGRGIQYKTGITTKDQFTPIEIWYPKNKKAISLNPEKAFNTANIFLSGIFAIEKQYDDNYVFVPLSFAQRLLEWDKKRTSLEIKTTDINNIEAVKSRLENLLGPKFRIQTSEEQHASLLRAIKVEKLFAYLTFSFIIGISSLNIFFSLSMLAIEKKKDIAVMQCLGANREFVKKIFLYVGGIIALLGAGFGLVFGLIFCLIQQQFGLVSMGMESSVVDAYPVQLQGSDFVFTGITIVCITLAASYRPSKGAAETSLKTQMG